MIIDQTARDEAAKGRAEIPAHVQACFSNERALGSTIEAALDVDSVLAIDLGQGWPA